MPPKKSNGFCMQEHDPLASRSMPGLRVRISNLRPNLRGMDEAGLHEVEQNMFAELKRDNDGKDARAAAALMSLSRSQTGQAAAGPSFSSGDLLLPTPTIPSKAVLEVMESHMHTQTTAALAKYKLAPAKVIKTRTPAGGLACNVTVTDSRNGTIKERDHENSLPAKIPTICVRRPGELLSFDNFKAVYLPMISVRRSDEVLSIRTLKGDEDSSLRLTQANPRTVDISSTPNLVKDAVRVQGQSTPSDFRKMVQVYNHRCYLTMTEHLARINDHPWVDTYRAYGPAEKYSEAALETKAEEQKETIAATKAPIGTPEDFERGTQAHTEKTEKKAKKEAEALKKGLYNASHNPDIMLAELKASMSSLSDSKTGPKTSVVVPIRKSPRDHEESKVAKPMKPIKSGKRPLDEGQTEASKQHPPKKRLKLITTDGSGASPASDSNEGTSGLATDTPSSAAPLISESATSSATTGHMAAIGSFKPSAGPPVAVADRPPWSPFTDDEAAKPSTSTKHSGSKSRADGARKAGREPSQSPENPTQHQHQQQVLRRAPHLRQQRLHRVQLQAPQAPLRQLQQLGLKTDSRNRSMESIRGKE